MLLMKLMTAHAILRGNFHQLPRTIMDVQPDTSADTSVPVHYPNQSLVTVGVPVQGANNYNKNAGKGGWGGQCTCADGQVYQVGDNGDSCATLACEGGIRGACNKHGGEWSGAAVTCAPPMTTNSFIEQAGTGGWGGECTCPDGSKYQVGDHWAACANLACVNGVSGTCNRNGGPWSGKGVVCAPQHLLAQPTSPPMNTSMPPMESGPPMDMPPVGMPPMEMPPMESGPPGGPPMAMECPPDQKDDAGRCPCPTGCVVDPLPKAIANGIVACPSRCYVAPCSAGDAYYYDAAPVIEKLVQVGSRLAQLEAKGLDMTEAEFGEYKSLVRADTTKLF